MTACVRGVPTLLFCISCLTLSLRSFFQASSKIFSSLLFQPREAPSLYLVVIEGSSALCILIEGGP